MVALERSLAQDTPAICGTTAKKKRARLIASTDSRRPKKEGGAATEPALAATRPQKA
jgi:hypothetical protein